MEITSRKVSEIAGLEQYEDYFVTISGDVYSSKRNKIRKLKPNYLTKKGSYLIVRLADGKGNMRNFYIHRLVAKLFLPNPTNSWGIEHIDSNLENNHLDNLRWISRKLSTGESDTDRLTLSKDLSDFIKLVHLSAIKKGIPVPDTYEFFHGILNESLEEYINRYGLKKTMYIIENS